MTRPLALIEGDLALPDARLLSSLPPPFGLRPQPARSTAQRDAERVAAAAAQEAIRTAARHRTPVHRRPLPPGTMFRFFYKERTPRDYSAHIQAQLDEARYYLDAGKTRVRSSRRDYVLAAGIFAATGIALAWLLTITAMHDAEKAGATLIARPAVAHSEEAALHAEPLAKIAPTVVQNAASMAKPVPLAVRPVESQPSHRAALPAELATSSRHTGSYKITRTPAPDAATRRAIASANASIGTRPNPPSLHLGKTQIDDRLTLSRSAALSAQASTSAQPEWTARAPSTDAAPEQAALLNWAAQQRRTSAVAASTTTTPASASAAPADVTWNARMTQRRITDNPGAFSANTSQR